MGGMVVQIGPPNRRGPEVALLTVSAHLAVEALGDPPDVSGTNQGGHH